MIFNVFISQLRTAIYLVLGQQKELKVHPFVVRKIRSYLWRWEKEKLLKFYEELANLDLGIKTGKIDYETALERIIVKI